MSQTLDTIQLIIFKQIETNYDDYLDRNRYLLETLLKECVFCHSINIRFDVEVAENFLHGL